MVFMLALYPKVLVKLEFGDFFLWRERKRRGKPLEQGENQQQTQPIFGTRPESSLGDISGRRVL